MSNTLLYIGVNLHSSLQELVDRADPLVLQFIVSEKANDYLQLVTYNKKRYLCKEVGQELITENLTSLESHIKSLLKKLHANFLEEPLVLFALNP